MNEVKHNFTLIVIKPSSEDTCRGCHMESYDSDHYVGTMLTDDELVEKWATYIDANANLRCNEKGFDFWIMIDGRMVVEEGVECWHSLGDDGMLEHDYKRILVDLKQRAKVRAEEIYHGGNNTR